MIEEDRDTRLGEHLPHHSFADLRFVEPGDRVFETADLILAADPIIKLERKAADDFACTRIGS